MVAKINAVNRFSSTIFGEKLKQANLETKADISDFIKKLRFDENQRKINNEFSLGSMFFTGDNIYQNFLVISPILNWPH